MEGFLSTATVILNRAAQLRNKNNELLDKRFEQLIAAYYHKFQEAMESKTDTHCFHIETPFGYDTNTIKRVMDYIIKDGFRVEMTSIEYDPDNTGIPIEVPAIKVML